MVTILVQLSFLSFWPKDFMNSRIHNWGLIFLALSCGMLVSCAGSGRKSETVVTLKSVKDLNFNQLMAYSDLSGNFSLRRTSKVQQNNILFQRLIYQDDFSKYVERIRSVSVLKTDRDRVVWMVPLLSQFSTWLEGQEYTSQVRIFPQQKKVEVKTSKPIGKFPLVQNFALPPSKYYCFLHLLPECIKNLGIFDRLIQTGKSSKNNNDNNKNNSDNKESDDNKIWIYVIMESFPYSNMIYSDIENKWMTQAYISYEGYDNSEHSFSVEIFNQMLSIKYNEKEQFTGMYWASQGITMSSQE